ncbi:MAG: hypothetical protein ABIO70_16950 [Pseudomonadota bacterium]
MLKRTLVSLAALGIFSVLAFGSKQSSTSDADFDDLFGEDFEKELAAAMEDAMNEGAEGGAGGGGSDLADNVAACKYYVEAYNGLSCLKSSGIQLNADDVCPSGLNLSTIDMREYYKCMADNSKCNGNIPDMSGVGGCRMPTQ